MPVYLKNVLPYIVHNNARMNHYLKMSPSKCHFPNYENQTKEYKNTFINLYNFMVCFCILDVGFGIGTFSLT